jgi:hypothetical protein
MYDVNSLKQILVIIVIENPEVGNYILFDYHRELRDRMTPFFKIYNELNPEFIRYLSNYM